MPEYHGYGGNAGAPSEDGFALDAQAAWSALERQGVLDPGIPSAMGRTVYDDAAAASLKQLGTAPDAGHSDVL